MAVHDYDWVVGRLSDGCRIYQAGINIVTAFDESTVPPAAIIDPESPTVDYTVSFGGWNEWKFTITLVPAPVSGMSAQQLIGRLISPKSDLIKALQAADWDGGHILVRTASIGVAPLGPALFKAARLAVTVRA